MPRLTGGAGPRSANARSRAHFFTGAILSIVQRPPAHPAIRTRALLSSFAEGSHAALSLSRIRLRPAEAGRRAELWRPRRPCRNRSLAARGGGARPRKPGAGDRVRLAGALRKRPQRGRVSGGNLVLLPDSSRCAASQTPPPAYKEVPN